MPHRDAILEFLSKDLGVDTSEIDDDTPLFSSGTIDSFSLVSLIGFIETTAGFRIAPTEVNLDNMDSLERLFSFIQRKTGD